MAGPSEIQWTTAGVSGAAVLARVEEAVMKVRERLLRATGALRAAGLPYAVVGGNAVAAWVGQKDPGAIRNTRDVDILVNRGDLPAIKVALTKVGFVHWDGPGFDVFRDGPQGLPSEGIHLLMANERIFADDTFMQPGTSDSEEMREFCVVSLEGLLRMKLSVNRDKDRTHVRDLIGVGWVDESWLARFPPKLAERLKSMLDTPNG